MGCTWRRSDALPNSGAARFRNRSFIIRVLDPERTRTHPGGREWSSHRWSRLGRVGSEATSQGNSSRQRVHRFPRSVRSSRSASKVAGTTSPAPGGRRSSAACRSCCPGCASMAWL
ncbi:MAG: hypothetical protein L6R43_08515 [Planctomycetes bacterium]|nr:hypothetical protein [Planctomycetota bacterium]